MDHKITSISTLSSLVAQDRDHHIIKDLAAIFLESMIDWPSMNQLEIQDFVKEVKDHFGTPVTIENLADAKLDMHTTHYWWRRESASSLIKMLQLAEKIDSERNFDRVIVKILEYYEKDLSSCN